MTVTDAAKVLNLPADATPEQIEARFLELRRKLEDKIAKAPTPGLQAKYRESLAEITTAFETLILAADSSALPVLQKQVAAHAQPAGAAPVSTLLPSPSAAAAPIRTAPRKKSGGKEFAIATVIAVILLGAGGWWVLKVKRANEEKARIAAEAQAEQERKVAAAKAEQERASRLLTSLRSQMAELNVAYDAQMRLEQIAERELADLRSKERDSNREKGATASPEHRRLLAQIRAQENLVARLRETLPSHPARFAKAKAEEMISARAAEEASDAVANYAAQVKQLQEDLAAARVNVAITGPLKLESNLDDTSWHLIDAFGTERSGKAPVELRGVAFGNGTVTFRRRGWPEQRRDFHLHPDAGTVAADFPVGSLRLESNPAGAQIFQDGKSIGRTPLEIPQMPPGPIPLRISKPGFTSVRLMGEIEAGKTFSYTANLIPGRSPNPEFIYLSVGPDLGQMGSPEVRAHTALELLRSAGQLDARDRWNVSAVLAAHLEACRAIRNPNQRFYALHDAMAIVAQLDFEGSRRWAEEAVSALSASTQPDLKMYGFGAAMGFAMHPDIAGRMLSIFANWLGNDEGFLLGEIARHQMRLGFDAAAERIASRNKNASAKLESGKAERPYAQMQVAFARRDLAAAQAALARVSTRLDFETMLAHSREFMRLGDFESPLRLAELGQNQGLTLGHYLSRQIGDAFRTGNHAVAEQWAARLTDTAPQHQRSQAYQSLAENYLDLGLKRQALAAANQVVSFSPGDNAYATDRYEAATVLAILGQTSRARELAASAPTTFDNKFGERLRVSVATFHLLGDTSSRDRVLRLLRSGEPGRFNSAYAQLINALCRADRPDEAASFLPQITDPMVEHVAKMRIARTRVRLAAEDQLDALEEQAPRGYARALVLAGILAQEATRQSTARYQPSR